MLSGILMVVFYCLVYYCLVFYCLVFKSPGILMFVILLFGI